MMQLVRRYCYVFIVAIATSIIMMINVAIVGAQPLAAPPGPAPARAIESTANRGTATAKIIPLGQSESVRTENGFSEVIVSDPDVVDATPLTDRSLSILGKKIGNTRVSVYGDGKKLVGVFNIEVSSPASPRETCLSSCDKWFSPSVLPNPNQRCRSDCK